jgi:phospholipid/cholesterol/gamma-HCH transport system substrate-binding protein
MTIARGASVLRSLVIALAAWLLVFRGSGGTTYTLMFENAGQLVKDDDVQVGGRRIGSVQDIERLPTTSPPSRIKVEEPYAPLREGTQAAIRLTSLSGIANRYIALTPAPTRRRSCPTTPRCTTASTQPVVDLDQLFNTLDEKTRGSLQDVIKGFRAQYRGKAARPVRRPKYFNPLLSTSRRLVGQVTADESSLTRVIVEGAKLTTALAGRRDDLSSLVSNTNTTAQAIASQNVALSRALGVLPTTLRRANTTFVNLRATLDDLDVLVDASKPATKDLAPLLRELRPLVAKRSRRSTTCA